MLKTKRMLTKEREIGKPLELAVPEALEKFGTIDGAANSLGIKTSTLYAWLPRLGLTWKLVPAK